MTELFNALYKKFEALYNKDKQTFEDITFKVVSTAFSKSLAGILQLITPSEIGVSISDEKSLDVFIEYKNKKIFYNMFFDYNVQSVEVLLDIYQNNESICSYDGSIEKSLQMLQKCLEQKSNKD